MSDIKAICLKTVRRGRCRERRRLRAKENIEKGEFGYKKNIDVILRVAKINILQRLL